MEGNYGKSVKAARLKACATKATAGTKATAARLPYDLAAGDVSGREGVGYKGNGRDEDKN